jgi:hypothetical protein
VNLRDEKPSSLGPSRFKIEKIANIDRIHRQVHTQNEQNSKAEGKNEQKRKRPSTIRYET